jgi:hypothetical protein
MIEIGCNEERITDLFNHSNDTEVKNLLKEKTEDATKRGISLLNIFFFIFLLNLCCNNFSALIL